MPIFRSPHPSPRRTTRLSSSKSEASVQQRAMTVKKPSMKKHRTPTHPGGILKRLYLQPLNLSTVALAKAIGVSRKTISKLVNERGTITPEMALRLSIAFNTTPRLWLNLQQNYDLWRAQRTAKGLKSIRKFAA